MFFFFELFDFWKYFHNFTKFWEYTLSTFETDIRGMFLEYSGNIISWLLEFVKRSKTLLTQKTTFPSRTFKKIFSFKMFPGCPKHCNTEGTLSEYFWNIACRLGIFVTSKIIYSYWFITIFILFILKMISYI